MGVRFPPPSPQKGNVITKEDTEEQEPDEYVYQAVVSYLHPVKAAIGVKAETIKEAENIVKENFENHLDFELISLEPASIDQIKQLQGEVEH